MNFEHEFHVSFMWSFCDQLIRKSTDSRKEDLRAINQSVRSDMCREGRPFSVGSHRAQKFQLTASTGMVIVQL